MTVILNTSILTTFGTYTYEESTLEEARELVRADRYCSAVGHQATADILTDLLGVPIPMNRNRIAYEQPVGELVLVFKLRGRPPEGVVLDRAGVEAAGYGFGLLMRTS